MVRQDFRFFHSLRVRWAEVDMQGIVFNGHYLLYADVAFTEYWRATGLPTVLQQASDGRELFARKSTIEYLAPARFDDVLDIGVRCSAIGRSSLTITLAMFCGDMQLTAAELVYVYTNSALRKSLPLPPAWRQVLAESDGEAHRRQAEC